MSLASNLLQLIFSLAVGIASLLGALFIIGFLLAVPRNEFEDDNHELTQPMFVPQMGDPDCPLQTGLGFLPVGCSLEGDTPRRDFNSTACDNTVCDQCTEDPNVICCCSASRFTSFQFTCEGQSSRTFSQPDQCTCQRCDALVVQLVFQVLNSTDGEVLSGAQLTVLDSNSSSPSSLTMDSAGFFSTFRQVSVGIAEVTASATGHAERQFNVTILPPGPLLFTVTLSAVTEMTLGSNVNESLNFTVDGGVDVTIPQGSVVTSDNQTFTGSVVVRTVVFSANETTYSDDLPSEITTMSDEGEEILYETRVLARTQLVDEEGNPLSVRESLSLSVDLSDFEENTTVTVLLYDGDTGIWSVLESFTVGSTGSRRKRQDGGNGNGNNFGIGNPNSFWAIATAINPSQICYLQVRTFENNFGLSGVTVSLQQVRDGSFFRRTGVTNSNSTGPVTHSVCIEVLCDTAGTVEAEFNSASIEPSETQPSNITISGNTITFNTTERSSSTPFYNSEGQCSAAGSGTTFVSFEVPLEPPPTDIPPEVPAEEFWFIRAEVLSCFESNIVTTLSVDSQGITSVASVDLSGSATGQVVDIPAIISPAACNGQVTRRTVCIEAFADSMVTLRVEAHPDNRDIGQLCYVSQLTNSTSSTTRTETTVQLDLTALSGGNPMAGLYFGDIQFVTQDQCQNPSSGDLDNPLQGFFAQFECFELPPDSETVELPAGCAPETFNSQTCSQVPCTTVIGDCTAGNDAQCCYREALNRNIDITCLNYNPFTQSISQTCSCQPCGDVTIDVAVTVTSSTDGSPVMGAMVDYAIAGGSIFSTITDNLGMFTITTTVSDVDVRFNITDANHMPETHQPIDLIPPGPLRISVVLLSRSTNLGPSVMVGSIATVDYSASMVMTIDGDTVTAVTSYIAAEMPFSFDTGLPPPVVISDNENNTYYAVRLIAATRLVSDSNTPLTASGVVETTFTNGTGVLDSNSFSLLTYNNNWMIDSPVTITPGNGDEVNANAMLSDSELPWAIGSPVPTEDICYVQVRTFRRDNNLLSGVEVEVLQLFEEFSRSFFFRSTGTTVDGSACLPVICRNGGRIRALYHVYLDAYPIQPMGFYPDGQVVNINTTTSSTSGPLFSSQDACMTSGAQYARFDLPIANPPPTDIVRTNNTDGFAFLRVSWHDCFDYNRVSTISVDPSTNNILAIYSSVVTESGEINNGIIEDPTTSGGMAINCTDGPMDAITARTACIQVAVASDSNVTLQVELNPASSMYSVDNELCSLNDTISSFMAFDASDNRLRIDLSNTLSTYPPDVGMNLITLNNMGIYFDQLSANIAYDQCMSTNMNSEALLSGSIAIFDCHTI